MGTLKKIGSALLALVMLCGVAFGVGWGITGTYNVTQWFKTPPVEGGQDGDKDKDGDDGNNGGNVTVEKSDNVEITIDENNSGITLMRKAIAPEEFGEYGVSEQAESAFTLTATVKDILGNTPSSMQYVKFEMPKDVTDSVKMTVIDDVTAKFECLKAFGTYIEVKVISTLDTSKYATVKLGYRPEIEGVHLVWNTYSYTDYNVDTNVTANGHFMKKFLPMQQYGNSDNYSHRVGLEISNDMINWGVGTEILTYDTVEVEFVATGAVSSRLQEVLGDEQELTSYKKTFTVRADSDTKTYISEDSLFVGLGLTYNYVFDYLYILNGNVTNDFFLSFKFSNSETGDEWAVTVMLAVLVPVIDGVGGVQTDKDIIIF